MSRESDFYRKLRTKIEKFLGSKADTKWGRYLMFAPDLFYLLWKLSLDPDVPSRQKAKLIGAIGYFISPIDLLPEGIIGPIGYLDDIAVAAYALNSFINETGPEIVQRHWPGEEDILEVIQSILQAADQMIGSGLWKKIKKRFD